MNRKDYRKIAKKHKVSVSEVKKNMQEAINETYKNPTLYAKCVPRKDEVPTIDEFINYSAKRVKILKEIEEEKQK